MQILSNAELNQSNIPSNQIFYLRSPTVNLQFRLVIYEYDAEDLQNRKF